MDIAKVLDKNETLLNEFVIYKGFKFQKVEYKMQYSNEIRVKWSCLIPKTKAHALFDWRLESDYQKASDFILIDVYENKWISWEFKDLLINVYSNEKPYNEWSWFGLYRLRVERYEFFNGIFLS